MAKSIGQVASQRRPQGTNLRSLLWLALILVSAALTLRWSMTRNVLLLRASRVPNADRFHVQALESYQWVTSDALIAFGLAERSERSTPIVRIDARTGAQVPMTALNNRMGAKRLRQARNLRISPDGRQLLFWWGQGARLHTTAVALDGAALTEWPVGVMAHPDVDAAVWLPDSRHWAYAQSKYFSHSLPSFAGNGSRNGEPAGNAERTNLIFGSLDAPQAITTVAVQSAPGVGISDLLGIDTRGRAIAMGILLPRVTRTETRAPTVVVKRTWGPTPVPTTGVSLAAGASGLTSSGGTRLVQGTVSSSGSRQGPNISTGTQGRSSITNNPDGSSTMVDVTTTTTVKYEQGGLSTIDKVTTTTTKVNVNTQDLELLTFDTKPNSVAQHRKIKLPDNAYIASAALSPQNDRIAMILCITHPPAIYPWSRWFPQQPALNMSYAIWECTADGSNLHEIGPEVVSKAGDPNVLAALRWLPNGKRVSFLYNEALYTLPAD